MADGSLGEELELLADFIVEHAEKFPDALHLLKEAFQALSTAERKIGRLQEYLIQHREAKKRKSSKAVSSEYDGNSTMDSNLCMTDFFTEAEDGAPGKRKMEKDSSGEEHDKETSSSSPKNEKKKKKKKKKLDMANLSTGGMTGAVETKEMLKMEDYKEAKEVLLLNTVSEYEADPLSSLIDHKEASLTSCKCDEPHSTDAEPPITSSNQLHNNPEPLELNQIRSPTLRVIPSALLMENPEQPDTAPPENTNPLGSSHIQEDAVARQRDSVESDDSGQRNNPPHILYFEFHRDIDKVKWLSASDIISELKKNYDHSLGRFWITIDGMKRCNDRITGYIIFPNTRSCFKAYNSGLIISGFRARMKPVHSVRQEPFADNSPIRCGSLRYISQLNAEVGAFRNMMPSLIDDVHPALRAEWVASRGRDGRHWRRHVGACEGGPRGGRGHVIRGGREEVRDDGRGEVRDDGRWEVRDDGHGEVRDDRHWEVRDDGRGELRDDGRGELRDDGRGEKLPAGRRGFSGRGRSRSFRSGRGRMFRGGR